MDQTQKQREENMKSTDLDWSKLCSDTLQLILESLSIADFHRARTVCSNWYSVSKSCVAGSRNRYPWLIIFLESESCFKLFDVKQEKIYKKKFLEDPKSRCVASYGNWLLMMSYRLKFSIFNVFTGERIKLPSLSLRGNVRFERKGNGEFLLVHTWFDTEKIINKYITMASLWIDEKTKDFVVCWIYDLHYLFSYKKGDDSWWHFEDTKCLAMAYKKEDQKLFVYTSDHFIKILDYSGDDFPNEIVQGNTYLNHPFYYDLKPWEFMWKRRIAITTSGDVLIILSLKGGVFTEFEYEEKRLFYIFKMNVEGSEWERVDSLGNQMLVFGDGFTLQVADDAKEDIGGGINDGDSIYFVAEDLWPPCTVYPSSAGVFDLATTEISWSQSHPSLSNIRWFVPGSTKK